jgi:hypothetical protein
MLPLVFDAVDKKELQTGSKFNISVILKSLKKKYQALLIILDYGNCVRIKDQTAHFANRQIGRKTDRQTESRAKLAAPVLCFAEQC